MENPKNYLKQPYARILIPEEQGGFHAEVLEFPGCFSQGDTADEAYSSLEEAAHAWIEARLSQGERIPEPFMNVGYGGKIALRLPRTIHRKAAEMAERDRTSLNSFLLSAISARVGAEDLYAVMAQKMEQRVMQAASQLAYAWFTWSNLAQTSGESSFITPAVKLDRSNTAMTSATRSR